MVDAIGYGTRAQFLSYRVRGDVNTGTATGVAASARASNNVINGTGLGRGQVAVDGKQASAMISLTSDTLQKIRDTLSTLQSELAGELLDGGTLTRSTDQPAFYTWQNTLVTSGLSKRSIAEYEYGDRSQSITVDASYRLIEGGSAPYLVDGVFGSTIFDGVQLYAQDVQGQWIRFDFGAGNKVIVDEATWQFSGSDTHGEWVWQGSNDGANFVSVSDSFTLGGSPTQVQSALHDNDQAFRYYRLLGVSGTATTQMHEQVFFRSAPEFPETATVSQNLSAQSLNTIDDKLQGAIAAIDNLVSTAEFNGANLLSSTGTGVVIRTSQFGGTLSVSPFPTDARALGLTGLEASSEDGALNAFAQVGNAISRVNSGIDQAARVQNGLLAALGNLAGGVGRAAALLPAGSLVNMIA